MPGDMILAIDPGTSKSGYAIVSRDTYRILLAGKLDNETLLDCLSEWDIESEDSHIEMIGSYGSRVGASVFETCIWIGRFMQVLSQNSTDSELPTLVKRATIKAHIAGKASSKDSDVIRSLVDRFTPGQKNYGKGTKDEPGWFYGVSADAWQAVALAVYAIDKEKGLAK